MPERLVSKLNTRLSWKLMASYLIVILVGVITLILAVEAAVPTAFERHLLGMQQMMGQGGLFGGGDMGETEFIGMNPMDFLLDMPLLSILHFQSDSLPQTPEELVDGLLQQVH